MKTKAFSRGPGFAGSYGPAELPAEPGSPISRLRIPVRRGFHFPLAPPRVCGWDSRPHTGCAGPQINTQIKPGMDTRLVIARFEAERPAPAMMDNAGIAKSFDAATTQSTVYEPQGRAGHSVPAENQPLESGAHGVTRPTLRTEPSGESGTNVTHPAQPIPALFRPKFLILHF